MRRTPARRIIGSTAVMSVLASMLIALSASPTNADTTDTAASCQDAAAVEGMEVVQQVALPTSTWNGKYDVDNSSSFKSFDRVGYCLTLQSSSSTQFVYASMQPYTQDATRIGIPTSEDDIRRERVSDLNVVSNVATAPVGKGQTGFIEMWDLNYDSAAAGQVPGASQTLYDAEDRPMRGGNHGSFQIHRIGEGISSDVAPVTAIAVNGWNSGTIAVGLGDGVAAGQKQPDWTFAANAGQYQSRVLTVYAQRSLLTLTKAPENLQLYPRQPDGTAHVEITGTADAQVTGIDLTLTRDDGQVTTTRSAEIAADHSFHVAAPITAELHTYKAQLSATTDTETRIVGNWDGLVAGDVVVVQGQSNAEAIARSAGDDAANQYTSEFVRSFGSPDQDPVISGAEHEWNYAQAWVGSTTGSRWNSGHVGLWALRAAQETVNHTGIPIALINGARGGQTIEYFASNDANPNDLSNNYGRLRSRMEAAGLLNSVSALFYYQGESDHDRAYEHVAGFGKLLKDWTRDFARGGDPKNIQYYAIQVRTACAAEPTGITLREAQRNLPETFTGYRVKVMSTQGIPMHDTCHFPFINGYDKIADYASGVLLRDFYGGDGANLDSPNPASVTGSAGERSLEMRLEKTTDPIIVNGDPSADFVIEGSTAKVIKVQSLGDGKLRFLLSGPLGSTPSSLTYLGRNGTGPTIATSLDVGLLSFYRFPITMEPAPDTNTQLASLLLDGTPLAGFDPKLTSYDASGTGSAPAVDAVPVDPAARVESVSSASRVQVKVIGPTGSQTIYTVWFSPEISCSVAAPWKVGVWGTASASDFCQLGSGTFRIGDQNGGVWTNSDALSVVYQSDALPVGGAFDVRLDSMTAAINPDSRAGIILRNDLSLGSATAPSKGYATLAVSSKNGAFLQWDSNNDGWIDSEGAKTVVTAPVYLRVTHPSATTVEGYIRSSVLDPWKLVGTATVRDAKDRLDVGFFANSNRTTAQETGMFSGAVLSTIAAPAVGIEKPTMSGDSTVGATLTASIPVTDPASAQISYQWLRDGVVMAGETATAYEVKPADVGHEVSVQVTGVADGRSEGIAQSTSLKIADIPSVEVSWLKVSGTVATGQTLTATTTATPTDATIEYQWYRAGTAIETGATHVVTNADRGTTLSVRATGSAPGYTSAFAQSQSIDVSALLGGWTFDDGVPGANPSDGKQYPDQVTGGRILTAQGDNAPGPLGSALILGGSARGVIAKPYLAGSFNGSDAISVSAWIKPTALPTSGTTENNWIFGSRINQASAGVDVGFVGPDLRVAGRSVSTDGYQQRVFAYPNDGRWHHIAAIVNYAGNSIDLYIDGVKQTPKSGTVNFTQRTYKAGTPTEPDTVGGSPKYGTAMFKGGIDEVRLYGAALSADQVKDLAEPHAPSVDITPEEGAPSGGWYSAPIGVRFSTQVLLPTGTAAIQYREQSGEWQSLPDVNGTTDAVIFGHSVHVIEARTVIGDATGGVSALTIKVDTHAPEVTFGTPANDVIAGTTTVSVAAKDLDSGLAGTEIRVDGGEWQPYDSPLVLGEVGTHHIEALATDNVGNTSEPIAIDVTVPSPTDPGNGAAPIPSKKGNVFFQDTISQLVARTAMHIAHADQVLVGDWDGDGIDTLALRNGTTYTFLSTNRTGSAVTTVDLGAGLPVVGDFNGDGEDDIALRAVNSNLFSITYSVNGAIPAGVVDEKVYFGRASDIPLAGDWDGDGVATLGIQRGAKFLLTNSLVSGDADESFLYGRAGDIPLVGDFDGDGKDSIAVSRGAAVYIKGDSGKGGADMSIPFGRDTDIRVAGDWFGTGKDTLVAVRK